jgi:hydrogenase nickel incorporation protein HypB
VDRVPVQAGVLQANQERAAENRALFDRAHLLVVNVMSSPGSGKTSILESTIRALKQSYRIGVIEGDLQTSLDAERIRALGVPSHQINTGTVCHLDARMVARALEVFPVDGLDLLFIENVGNLICPPSYYLGEDLRVVICSVVEGADKPKKYPVMFNKADVVVLNKTDLIEYSGADLQTLTTNVREVSPLARIFALSCRTGQGMEGWLDWLRQAIAGRASVASAKAGG